jgi:hypothetical protein
MVNEFGSTGFRTSIIPAGCFGNAGRAKAGELLREGSGTLSGVVGRADREQRYSDRRENDRSRRR